MGGGLPGLHWSGAEVEWHGCGVLLVKNSQGHVKGVAGVDGVSLQVSWLGTRPEMCKQGGQGQKESGWGEST